MKNYYKVLELPTTASKEEIKQKYRELSKQYHPDLVVNKENIDLIKNHEEKFKEINEAYSVLSDPEKKKAYDKKLLFWDEAFQEYFEENTW